MRPWLKAGNGVLKTAGETFVWNDTLPRAFLRVSALPKGEDVIVGGTDGYLAVFLIRYSTESYRPGGHSGNVLCVAVCPRTCRDISGSEDETVRVWKLRTETQQCETVRTVFQVWKCCPLCCCHSGG